ncbi:carbohydrate porin [Cetobacterium sp. ZOR0034]|uniref:carbohydrate porin n=1 Tax=Cetobacterium sp. ZOR0034 TaxID=1339239 RepID=UPI000647502E|nr:carbohydrate porin [Cetobacterium sp. ZOR0034]
MKKFVLLSLLCTLALQASAEGEKLSLDQRIEKLEQIIENQNKELNKQKLNIKKNEKKLSLSTQAKPKTEDDQLQFHGYLRTGAEGNMKNGNKNSYSKNKEYVGRWGNEYDTNFNINLSKKFTQSNGAWTKLAVQLESWSDNYDNSVGDSSKIDLTELYVEMGNVPMFSGAFKDSTIIAGKKKWDDQQVEVLDYYYQDVNGTGLGIEKIKLWDGDLSLSYISNDFKDGEVAERDKRDKKISEDIRAYKAKYTYKDIAGEIMYAHATDNADIKEVTDNDDYKSATVTKREAADDGLYLGLYYQPNNFFGFEGKGQHYLQYSTGLLAGEGIGKIDTDFNKRAADDAVTYQLGLGGTVKLGKRTHMLVSYRSLRAENIEARKYDSYAYNYPGADGTVYDRTEFQNSWRVNKLESDALVLRPIYYVNQNLDLWIEAGIGRRDAEAYNGNTEDHKFYKISAGPQLKYYVGSAETSLRLFVTYIGDETKKTDNNVKLSSTVEDVITGFQVSAWW